MRIAHLTELSGVIFCAPTTNQHGNNVAANAIAKRSPTNTTGIEQINVEQKREKNITKWRTERDVAC